MSTSFIVDEKGKKRGVVVSLKEYKQYKKMLDYFEMNDDIDAFDKDQSDFEKDPKTYTLEEGKKRLGYV